MSAELVIRRAVDSDAAGIADVWLRSFRAALPTVRLAHGDDEVRDWFSAVVIPGYETWVAAAGWTGAVDVPGQRTGSTVLRAARLR